MNRDTFSSIVRQAVWCGDYKQIELIKTAYYLAKQIHRPQVRDSGERYFEHCRGVAEILIEYPSRVYAFASDDPRTKDTLVTEIIVALLHDTVEDAYPPNCLLEKLFGPYISLCVAMLSKVEVLETSNWEIAKNKKTLDAYFKAIAHGPYEVRRVKMADRLHNLRSMDTWPVGRKRKAVDETRKYILQPAFIDTDERLTKLIKAECNKIEKTL